MSELWTIRSPNATDLSGLAELKTEWSNLQYEPGVTERAYFARQPTEWMDRLGDSVVCRIAVDSEARVIGMAWLVIFDRVPNFDQPHRLSADLQSVFVTPESRRRGIGGALVASLCAEADARGIALATLHSSPWATSLYERQGFASSGDLLARVRPDEVAGH